MQKDNLKISGYEDIRIINFDIIKEVNKHSECMFSFSAGCDDPYGYTDAVGNKISISNGYDYLFFGIIDNISVDTHQADTIVYVSAMSESISSDNEKHKRIFQNPDKTIKSIISYISNEDNLQITTDSDKKIEEPILQKNETDFTFINRIASENNLMLFVDDTAGENNIRINLCSNPNGDTAKIEEKPFKYNIQKIIGNNSTYQLFSITLHDTFFNLGQLVSFNKQSGYITKVRVYMKDYIIYYEYTVCNCDHICVNFQTDDNCRILLSGKITDTDCAESTPKGMVKVDFDCEYIDTEPDKKSWIPYRTPYVANGGGFIFIPDKDDVVQIVYSDNVMWAEQLFNESPISKDFCEFKNKYIANVFSKIITFAEDNLELSAKDTKIKLTDDSITLLSGDSQICMNNDQISLNVKDSKIVINKDSVLIDSNKSRMLLDKKASIETDDHITINSKGDFLLKSKNTKCDSNGGISFKASADIKLNGTQIHLK
ncbi:MAG: hypothetical protein OSJ61_03660 [Lachnospiraceae bacterium]|nr:hypothetical protein [Lachnospiraceae bacterium]